MNPFKIEHGAGQPAASQTLQKVKFAVKLAAGITIMSALILVVVTLTRSRTTMGLTVHDVCVKSSFPLECEKILKSDHRSKTSDIFVIARIAADKAVISVTSTFNEISSLVVQAKNPIQKRNLEACSSIFGIAKDHLGRANDLIRTNDGEALNGIGAIVAKAGFDCQAALGGGSTLFKENTEAKVIGDAIAVASNLFPRRI